jgi:hypothetical protein
MVEGERAVSNLAELHARLRPCFGRAEPFAQAGKYVRALMSDLPRKNGWTIAEHAGDLTPDRTQRLLNHAVWDTDQAQVAVRGLWPGTWPMSWWWVRWTSRGSRSRGRRRRA